MDRVRSRGGVLAGTAVVVWLLAAFAPAPRAYGAGADHTRVRVIAPGVTLTTFIDVRTPQRTFVLTVDPAQGASIDAALAGGALGRNRQVAAIADSLGALAGVNGDFTDLSTGRPAHPMVDDGQLVQTSRSLAESFVLDTAGSITFATPSVSIQATEIDTGEILVVDRWNNGQPHLGEIAAFTDAGGDVERSSQSDCAARLAPSAPSEHDGVDVVRDYTVSSAGCTGSPVEPDGGLVLSAQPSTDEATILRSLATGESVRLTWSVGLPEVRDMLGGGPLLVDGGRDVVGACSGSICGPNPRTAVGVTADGRFLLVVADGRQPGYSVGMTMGELARLMLALGAQRALNLDGGGSSTMAVKGAVVNHPSDGGARPVSTALLVLPPSG